MPTIPARPLTAAEADVLWAVLCLHPDEVTPRAFARSDLARLRVVGVCGCGCASIALALDGIPADDQGEAAMIADADGETDDGRPVGLVVYGRDGWPIELEVYSYDEVPGALPRLESLK